MSVQPEKPLVIGHRGLPHSHPENTIPSFQAAIAAKADMIELDFQVTADAALVCVHDVTMKRYVDPALHHSDLPARPVSSYTLAQLKELEVGAWKDARFKGTQVPTLGEALDACRGTVLLVERKSGTPEQTLAVLNQHAAIDRVIVQAYDMAYLKAMRALAPTLALVALGSGTMGNRIDLATFHAAGAGAIHWNDRLRAADIDAMHAGGLAVWVYTLNSEIAWRGATELRIDGITTDYCDAIRQVILSPGFERQLREE